MDSKTVEHRQVSAFSDLMLIVRRQEGYRACKTSATTVPNSLHLGTGLTWSNLTWGPF